MKKVITTRKSGVLAPLELGIPFEGNAPQGKKLLTRPEAAEYLGIKPQTLAVWATTKRYGLPLVKVGRLVKYRKEDLDAFIIRNLAGGND